MKKQLISVIIPVFNEEENIERTYVAIIDEFKKYDDIDYEIIFTDNASIDHSYEKLTKLAQQNERVRVIRFVRNFGFQRSILAGYRCAKGDAAIQIDCDLEDPPSIFKDFIHLWRNGHDVVIGIRSHRLEPFYIVYLRRFYYKILNHLSDVPHLIDAGDFRLVDKRIIEQLHHINDAQPYVRGIISELANNQIGVHYQRSKRIYGSTKFPLRQLIKLASDGLYSYSIIPLRIATYLGTFITLITTVMIFIYVMFHFFLKKSSPQGFTTTTILILFGISVNALLLGIIGEYIGRIHNQLRKRPLVVVDKSINIDYHQLLHFNDK